MVVISGANTERSCSCTEVFEKAAANGSNGDDSATVFDTDKISVGEFAGGSDDRGLLTLNDSKEVGSSRS